MIRSYVCNLMFRDRPDPIVDSENPNWRFFHGDIEGQWYNGISFSNPSLMGQYNKGFNSMKIFKPNYYIKNIEKVDMRKHWEYTLSLRFRIDQEWMSNMGLEWFYRFIQEPRRLWNRYVVGNWKFVAYTYKVKREQKAAKA